MSQSIIAPIMALGGIVGKLNAKAASRLSDINDRLENSSTGWETAGEMPTADHVGLGGIRSFGNAFEEKEVDEVSSPESKLARKFGQMSRTHSHATGINGLDNARAASELHAAAAEKAKGTNKAHHQQASAAYKRYATEANEYTAPPMHLPYDPNEPGPTSIEPVDPKFDAACPVRKAQRDLLNAAAKIDAAIATNMDPKTRDRLAGDSEGKAKKAWQYASHNESKACCSACKKTGGSCQTKTEGVTGAIAGGVEGGLEGGPLGAIVGGYLGSKTQDAAEKDEDEDTEESLATNAAAAEFGALIGGPQGMQASGFLGNEKAKKNTPSASADTADGALDSDQEADESVDEAAKIQPGRENMHNFFAIHGREQAKAGKKAAKSGDQKTATNKYKGAALAYKATSKVTSEFGSDTAKRYSKLSDLATNKAKKESAQSPIVSVETDEDVTGGFQTPGGIPSAVRAGQTGPEDHMLNDSKRVKKSKKTKEEAQIIPGKEAEYKKSTRRARSSSRYAKEHPPEGWFVRKVLGLPNDGGEAHTHAAAKHREAASYSHGTTQKRHLAAANAHDVRATSYAKESQDLPQEEAQILQGREDRYKKDAKMARLASSSAKMVRTSKFAPQTGRANRISMASAFHHRNAADSAFGKTKERHLAVAAGYDKKANEDLSMRNPIQDTGAIDKSKLDLESDFSKLSNKLAKKPGVTDPDALAAVIGRKSLGKKKFQAKAVAGKKKAHHEEARRNPSAIEALCEELLSWATEQDPEDS